MSQAASGGEGLRVRVATPDDLEIVLHHRREMFRDMGFATEAELATAIDASRSLFLDALADGNYRGWLVEREDTGTVVAGGGVNLVRYQPSPRDPQERRPWVINVYTEPAYRRRGLARMLMETMIAWTREQGYRNLYLHASADGRPLYVSLGFVPTNEMRLAL